MKVFITIIHRLIAFLRVRNSHQLHGPTLLRTNGKRRKGSKLFKPKNDPYKDRLHAFHSRW